MTKKRGKAAGKLRRPDDRRAQFVREYIIDFNATQAAIRAGYSKRSAGAQGHRLLTNAEIQAQVQEAVEARARRTEVTADRVLEELAKVGFANMGDFVRFTADGDPVLDMQGLDREKTAALSEVVVEDFVDGRGPDQRDVKRVKFKLYDKLNALGQIGKHLGMFIDKRENRNTDKDGNDIPQAAGVLIVPGMCSSVEEFEAEAAELRDRQARMMAEDDDD